MYNVYSAKSLKGLSGSWSHTTMAGGRMRLIDSLEYHDNAKRTCTQVRQDLIEDGYPSDIIVKKAK